MNKNKYLLKNSAIFALGNIGTKLINFFLVPLYTHVLSQKEYGSVDLMFTICSLIIPVVMCNINEAIMRFLMDKSTDEYEISSVGLVTIMIGFTGALLTIPIFKVFEVTNNYAIPMYCYIVFSAMHSVVFYYLRGKEMLLQYSICSIMTTLIVAILNVLFLVVLHWGIQGYFLAYNSSYLITSIIAILVGKQYKTVTHFHFNMDLMKRMVAFSIALVPNSLLWWTINSSDRVMVSSMVSLDANGLYGVSYKIPSLLSTLSHIFMQAWTYSAVREKQGGGKGEYDNYIYDKMFGMMILVSGGLIVGTRFLFKILFAESYYTAWEYSPFLIIGFFFLTMATFLGTTYYVEKNTFGTMLSALFGAVINVVLNFLLIPAIGANGAAIATGISYISIYCYRAIDTKKYIDIKVLKLKYIISVILLFLLGVTVYSGIGIWNPLLFIEYAVLCFVQKDFIIIIFKGLVDIILKKKSNT